MTMGMSEVTPSAPPRLSSSRAGAERALHRPQAAECHFAPELVLDGKCTLGQIMGGVDPWSQGWATERYKRIPPSIRELMSTR